MLDRQFTEIEVRDMLDCAVNLRPDTVDGRWVVSTNKEKQPWEVIVEPEAESRSLLVITAYRTGRNKK